MATPKVKVVFDVVPDLRDKWMALCRRENLTQAEMFRKMLAEKEGSAMAEGYAGLRIELEVFSDDLFSDATGADVRVSGEKYAKLLEDVLISEYPGAAVEVSVAHNITGRARRIVEYRDGLTNPAQVDAEVSNIEQRVFEDSEKWVVAATTEPEAWTDEDMAIAERLIHGFPEDVIIHYMDDDIREQVHRERRPMIEEFVARYVALHRARFGEEFQVN